MDVANTILEQLGGRQFALLTGSKNFLATENGLRMNVGRNAKGVNVLEVRLEPTDTYTVVAYRRAGGELIEVETSSQVYCDTLKDTFEGLTGLYTTLMPR
jgi:hypothetical protein